MKRVLLILSGLLLVAYLASGVYQVQPGERAVVRRLGKVMTAPRLPGLHIGLPWGFDRVDRIAVDERRQITVGFFASEETELETAPPGQVLTGDHNLLDLRMTVYYRVNPESEAVVDFALNAERVDLFLTRSAEVALIATLAGQRVDNVLLGQAKNLEALLQEQFTQTLSGYPLGIGVESVNLTYIRPPSELVEVFREVNRARTQKEIAEREALAERQTVLTIARNDARRLTTDAEVYHHRHLSQARAEAQSFLALWNQISRYSSDPQNAVLNLYLTEMQAILSRMQVRTLADPKVEQTIIMPLPD